MADTKEAARAQALAQELGAQLRRLTGAGPKLKQFLSILPLDDGPPDLGALPEGAEPAPFNRVKKVIEKDGDARLRDLFADFDEKPFALSSLGQVHRAETADGAQVAVKVQHAGAAESAESDLRNIGVIGPILKRLAPGLDSGAVLAEIRERISDELDYEVEAQHQRRLERRFRGHPHVRIPRVHTDLSTRRVLVTEYVKGRPPKEIGDAERDRAGEIAFRFFFGLAWRDGTLAGDPHADNCLLCPDGRLCVLDFGLARDVEPGYDERAVLRAIAGADAPGLHAGLAELGYLPDPDAFDPDALLEHLGGAGAWLLSTGPLRIDPGYVGEVVEFGYPPQSPHFASMRRLRLPPPTLLMRRVELQMLALLGEFRAQGDWAAISAEHHSGEAVSTALGREDQAFFARH